MTLWCSNAVPLKTPEPCASIGIVCEADSVEHAMRVFTTMHPDKTIGIVLPWCPIWLCEFWQIWQQWHHLRGHASLLLHPFNEKPFPVYDTAIFLRVAAFTTQYDPFILSQWIWGEPVARSTVAAKAARGHAVCRELSRELHVDRIVNLILHRAHDPVQVMEYFVADTRWIIGDGTHRFAAALVRGDSLIAAVTTKEWAERLLKDGLAETA